MRLVRERDGYRRQEIIIQEKLSGVSYRRRAPTRRFYEPPLNAFAARRSSCGCQRYKRDRQESGAEVTHGALQAATGRINASSYGG
jgi:hypothetical protein